MPLTDTAIRKAKPVRLFNGGGLYLEISPAGCKLWRLKYRFGGREKRQAFGAYPDVSRTRLRHKKAEQQKATPKTRVPTKPRVIQRLRSG